ncbi:MAG: hypothetical protein L0Y71_09835 [Gemmataceae bacterium]|nr:hypothetical protein [Gemmataceae bacterium]
MLLRDQRTRFVSVSLGALLSLSAARLHAQADNAAAAEKRTEARTAASALALFEKRILPIFQSKKPSSCTECHLSSVELKDYIHPTQEKTFAALVQGGLVDAKNPDKSKILEFIARKPAKPNLITDKVRQQEYEAFRAWLRAAVADPDLLSAKLKVPVPVNKVSPEVVRHTRKDRVLKSFVENVWSEMPRCVHCHSPEHNRKHIPKLGQDYVDRLSWIVPNDPQATMDRLGATKLIDVEHPEASLLLTKPTLQVAHKGGIKMLKGDRTYRQFRSFVDDYAAIMLKKYLTAGQLPKPSAEAAVPSDIILRINGIPARFDKMPLHVDLYRWRDADRAWSPERWASAEWFAFAKAGFWQFKLHLTAPRGSSRAADLAKKQLPPGRYLVKVYVDHRAKLGTKSSVAWDDHTYVGQVEVVSDWHAGAEKMTAVRFPGD